MNPVAAIILIIASFIAGVIIQERHSNKKNFELFLRYKKLLEEKENVRL